MNERPGNEVGSLAGGPLHALRDESRMSETLLGRSVGNEPLVTRFMTVEPFTVTVLVADVECVSPLCDSPGADAVGEGDSVGT